MATKIEWTQKVWNPVTGCTKVSEACQNCYAKTMARRLQKMPGSADKYRNGFKPTIHPECLNEPYEWKKPCMVFVVSMGDLFHEEVPLSFIDKVMNIIEDNPQHTFQVLTKRAERMADFFTYQRDIPKNVWLGVTCESSNHYDRIFHLRRIMATVRFLSCEPLLGDMADIDLTNIDWVITGGESGSCARRTPVEWFRTLRDVCQRNFVPFFFKQWGAWSEDGIKQSKYKNGSLLDDREWKEYPNV
jgi:protein gp37